MGYMNKQSFEGLTYASGIANNAERKSVGRVVATNEWENTCDIIYRDHNNKQKKINNVPVKIYPGSNWFPKIDMIVDVSDWNDNNPIIMGPIAYDYTVIREQHMDDNDIMAYGNATIMGGGYG